VSWKRLIHISWTAVRTDDSVELAIAETNVSVTEVMLTVIWNWIWELAELRVGS
jgi:hypothetical protein